MLQVSPIWGLYILVLIFACLNIWILMNRRIHKKVREGKTDQFRRNCIVCTLVGIILILLGIGLFISIWIDIRRSPEWIRAFSALTSEPAQLLAVTLFIVGLTTVMTGISYLRVQHPS
jgi:O-antigen/teichoic acid export membrane protein